MKPIESLPMKKLTIDEMNIPMKTIYKRLPNLLRSVFVVYPKTAIPPNAPADTKKVFAIDCRSYTRNIEESINPIRPEYKVKSIVNVNIESLL